MKILFFLFILAFCIMCKKLEKEMMVSTVNVDNITFTTAEVSSQIVDLGNGISQY